MGPQRTWLLFFDPANWNNRAIYDRDIPVARLGIEYRIQSAQGRPEVKIIRGWPVRCPECHVIVRLDTEKPGKNEYCRFCAQEYREFAVLYKERVTANI